MVFYDFEVFKKLWLVVLINPEKRLKKVIINTSPNILVKLNKET